MKVKDGKKTVKRVIKSLPKGAKATVILLATFGVLISLLSTYSAILIKNVINSAVSGGNDLTKNIVFYGCYIVLLLVVEIAFSLISVRNTAKIDLSLRKKMMQMVVAKDYKGVTAYHSGDLISRSTLDVSVLSAGVTQVVPNFLSVIMRVISAFALLLFTDYRLALIIFAIAPVTVIASRIYGKKIKSLHHAGQRREARTRSFMTELVQNMTVIRAFRSEKPVFNYFDELQKNNFDVKMKINRFSVVANVLMFLSVSLVYFFTIIWGANRIALEGAVAFGTLTATLQLVTQFQGPLRSLSSLTNQYYRAVASAERIFEIEDISESKGAVELDSSEDFTALKIEGVSFSYEDGREVISNLTFEVKRGEVVAITGPSGAGKSTLLKLVMGLLVPSSGRIYLEGAESEDNRAVFSYVPQGNMILSGSLRDNVTFFNNSVSEEKIHRALELCALSDVVASLPNGIDSVIGERGTGLSEGQVQRLSIARAIVMDKKILLLDEATSALDEATERQVLDNLVKEDYTVLIVTHNKTVRDICDRQIRIN